MKLRRIVSCMMALLLAASLPVSAMAAEYDLAQGSVTVNASESGQTVTHGSNDAVSDDAPVIIQSNNETPTSNTITINADAGTTANVTIQDVNIVVSDDTPKDHSGKAAVTIDVAKNAEANVTLDGVDIDTKNTGGEYQDPFGYPDYFSGEAAVQIRGNGDVTLELDGENALQSGYNRAGVEKNTTDSSGKGNLTITDETGTSGTLKATGGEAGSGIGGGCWGSGRNIIITGSVEVTAQGGWSGSGIGGGFVGSGSDITIEGSAEVTAQGGNRGSGIGGGNGGSGSDITIEGSAEVIAIGGEAGSGIGGGYRSTGSDITVSQDAQVKAQGGKSGCYGSDYFSAGAAIGDGGKGQNGSRPDAGQEVPPITGALNEGWIATYAPGTTDLDTATPDTLTYQDANGSVQIATENIAVLPAQSATDDTHEQKAGFKVGDVEVAVKTHRYGNYQPDDNATCTHDGTESAKCTVPGCTAKLERTAPGTMKDHEYGDYVPDADNLATCTKAGTKTAKCDHCDATHTIPDPIKDHSMGAYHTETPATCQKEGVERRDCANCDYFETRPIDKLKHSFTNYISDNNATYEADGTKTAKCDHCDATDTIPDPGSKLVRKEAPQTASLYRVIGQDGKAASCKKQQKDGVLTITVDADFATLTGSLGGMKTLKAQGVDTIVFETNGATSTFALSDLLAQGSSTDSYALTHDGTAVTFTLGAADVASILK